MLSGEISGIHYMPPAEIQIPHNPSNYVNNIMQDNNLPSSFHLINGSSNSPLFSNVLFQTQIPLPVQSSSLSNNSSSTTSDEAEYEHVQLMSNSSNNVNVVIDQRKQRRMISNRESARRSRMRKQKHLDELWSQVVRLRTENHSLIDRLNHVSESHDIILQENAKLKEEASGLRQMLAQIQINQN